MTNNQYFAIAAVVVVALGYLVIEKILSKKYLDDLTDCLLAGKFTIFDKMCENRTVKFFVNPFNIDYLKLNSYLMRSYDDKVTEMYEKFKKVKLTDEQKKQVYSTCLPYFFANEKEQLGKDCYGMLKQLDAHQSFELQYEIVIEHKCDKENQLLAKLENSPLEEKGSIAYLLSVLYSNKGDEEKENRYYELSKEYLTKVSDALSSRLNK